MSQVTGSDIHFSHSKRQEHAEKGRSIVPSHQPSLRTVRAMDAMAYKLEMYGKHSVHFVEGQGSHCIVSSDDVSRGGMAGATWPNPINIPGIRSTAQRGVDIPAMDRGLSRRPSPTRKGIPAETS